MEFKDINGFIGNRQWAAFGVLASVFVALLALQLAVWSFVVVGTIFVGYAAWNVMIFLTQQHFNGRSLTACVWPVSIALAQALAGLALAWVLVWLAQRIF